MFPFFLKFFLGKRSQAKLPKIFKHSSRFCSAPCLVFCNELGNTLKHAGLLKRETNVTESAFPVYPTNTIKGIKKVYLIDSAAGGDSKVVCAVWFSPY